jgi:hypothetical protein
MQPFSGVMLDSPDMFRSKASHTLGSSSREMRILCQNEKSPIFQQSNVFFSIFRVHPETKYIKSVVTEVKQVANFKYKIYRNVVTPRVFNIVRMVGLC